MKLLDRYLAREFIYNLIWALLAFWVVFLIVNLVDNLDKFIDKGAPAKYIALYYFYYTPFIVILVLPIAVLLATLFSVGFLSKRSELLAMRASGVSLLRLALPLLVLGMVISGAVFAAGETIYPKAESRRLNLADQFMRRTQHSQILLRNLYASGLEGRVFFFKRFNTAKGVGTGVTVQSLENGRLKDFWEMKELRFEDSLWVGTEIRRRVFTAPGDTLSRYLTLAKQAFPSWRETPADFVRRRVDPEHISYTTLKGIIARMRATGGDTTVEETELQLKVAYPFLNLLVILVGFPIAARTRQSGMALNFGIAMGIIFILRVLIEVFRSLGHNGDISPLLAAWTPNLICLAGGILALIMVRK